MTKDIKDGEAHWAHPHYGADISPCFSASYHQTFNSRLARFCDAANISIHDRNSVYEQMKLIESNPNKK